MLGEFLILLACHSFFAVAFPQLFQPASGPAGVTPYLNSSTVTSQSTSSKIVSTSAESSSTSISTSESSVLSTSALGTSPPGTSPLGTAPLGTAPLGTGVASSCPTTCSYDGPVISGYQWVPVVGNQTITATIVIQVVSLTANVSGPYGTGGSSLSTVGTETLYNSLPANVNLPFVNEFGSAYGMYTTIGADGVVVGTSVAYPTNALDYASTFAWSGALPTATGGSSSCASTGAPQTETLAAHPAYSAVTPLPTNVDGTNYALVPADFVDVAFLRASFPDEEQFSACAPPIIASNQTAVTGAVFVTVTTTANATIRGWQTNAPIIEHTVSSDDPGLGNFSPFVAHTEESVPIDDNTSHGGAMSKAHTEATVPAEAASTPTGSSGGSSGGSGQAGSGGSSNSGSDSGLAGAIASAVASAAAPGNGAGSSGAQATALPESSGSSSGGSSSSGGTAGGSSSSDSSSGGSGSGQGSSAGSSSGGSSSGSSGGSGSSGQGSSSGGSSSGGNAGGGSSGSGASSNGGSTGGSSSGSNAGSGSSSGGSLGGGSGSSGSSSNGGQAGSGSSSSGGSNGGSGANAGTPPQSIVVGSSTLAVIHTTIPVTSNVGGTPVTSNVPAVVIGGSTATLGQTLTLGNTPVAFTATPTAGSSSSSNGGSGSNAGSSSDAGSGSGSSNSGFGSSGSSGSSNSGSGSLGSGDALVIGGTSTVPLLPIATGSSGLNAAAPITVGSQLVAPTSLAGGSGIGFVVGGQTLAPGHPITLGSGSQTTVVSLTTNSQGDTLLIQGTQTQTLDSGLSPITLGPQTIQATSLPGGGEGFVIGSQTLGVGHPITLGSGTVLSLTTDSAGDTLLVSGTSTKTLAGPGSSGLAAITLGTQVIQPTELPNGDEGFIISGQTLFPGHPITLGTGSHTTLLSLTTDSAGDTILISGTSTRTLAGPHSTSIGGYVSGGLGGANNTNLPEQSNGAGRLMIGTQNGKGLFALSMAMVMGIAGTIVIL